MYNNIVLQIVLQNNFIFMNEVNKLIPIEEEVEGLDLLDRSKVKLTSGDITEEEIRDARRFATQVEFMKALVDRKNKESDVEITHLNVMDYLTENETCLLGYVLAREETRRDTKKTLGNLGDEIMAS